MEYTLFAGIDVGSTTTKIAIVEPQKKELVFHRYVRHNADQAQSVAALLREAHREYPKYTFILTLCGSGGISLARDLGAFFMQEVMANAIAIRQFYPMVRTAIELGGQDAKVIFFRKAPGTGSLIASDMRMNGSCAGGTGAFIDQIAELLNIPVEDFNDMAARGSTLYDISGRCGVFAKTDIQPLLNQGVAREDIALSSFHAIAKQTIGGLAQGMEIQPPVIFEGGPLTFNRRLIDVFRERIPLAEEAVIIPPLPEIIIAHGAAISPEHMFQGKQCGYSGLDSLRSLEKNRGKISFSRGSSVSAPAFFKNDRERELFFTRHRSKTKNLPDISGEIRGYIGIDAGSTTTKFVLLSESGDLLYQFYSGNHGDPLRVIQHGLLEMEQFFAKKNSTVTVIGAGTTGYGEKLFSSALRADYHTVETVAHAEAAKKYVPDASFILDIGGQDMKAIYLNEGIVTNIVLNEACSAGCGSFLETYARSLGIAVEEIAETAFLSRLPSKLGSRCTVFMNSSIITEQKNGKTSADIFAGLCRSIIENVFTKVVRLSNPEELGDHIVVQGGTFLNNAVLRSFEQYLGKEVYRPPYPGQMGSIGIALLTQKNQGERRKSGFIGFKALRDFEYTKESSNPCTRCANNCGRTIIRFNTGDIFITGNRCERGLDIGAPSQKDKDIRGEKEDETADMVRWINANISKTFDHGGYTLSRPGKPAVTIGIPRVLEFWSSLPFWNSLFAYLGFRVIISRRSTYNLFEKGLKNIPSDTICFPAKLVHGHILDLAEKKVDKIFLPMMVRIPKENESAADSHVCSVVQGYPLVAAKNDDTEERFGIPILHPVFHWYNEKLKKRQVSRFLVEEFGVSRGNAEEAFQSGIRGIRNYERELVTKGAAALSALTGDPEKFGVLLAGRPYHADVLVNHDISRFFTSAGIPVFTVDSLPDIHDVDLDCSRMETTIPFHTRMIEAAIYAARHPDLELVQIVSFGCGHDAVLSDEITRILRNLGNKEPLVLKLDESESRGPMNIRITSFIETVRQRRKTLKAGTAFLTGRKNSIPAPFAARFLPRDRKKKIILTPNLSYAFSRVAASVLRSLGYKSVQMPMADESAIALGKKYVHNDICFPAQVNIGEAISLLRRNILDTSNVALALAKNCEDCRAGQYAMLARKALDDAGYPEIPIITTGRDTKNIHPGARLGLTFQIQMVWGIVITDALEIMRRAIQPYESIPGSTENLFKRYADRIAELIPQNRNAALKTLSGAVADFNRLPVQSNQERKPRVGIVGEILLNYHPGSNHYIEEYLVKNGMEVVIPPLLGFFRRAYVIEENKGKRKLLPRPFLSQIFAGLTDSFLGLIEKKVGDILAEFRHPYIYSGMYTLVSHIKDFIDVSYQAGEGWLLPAEIIEMIRGGIHSFVIVQPFGCLPNHITGRGMVKTIKKIYPDAHILSLDYDPDTSLGNVENRLQMLILSARERHQALKHVPAPDHLRRDGAIHA